MGAEIDRKLNESMARETVSTRSDLGWDGVNFALYAENAERVELCLFDGYKGEQEIARITIDEHTNYIWHVCLPDARPGQLYGYKVYGPYDPHRGHRFNPDKILLDPYARAISGVIEWGDEMFGYRVGSPQGDSERDTRDNTHLVPKSVVVDPTFDWEGDQLPRIPFHETVLYETHVKGLTRLHPDIPVHLRGTYASLGQPEIVEYFKMLGVTALELMPIHQFVADRRLVELGLTNYWGYNSIGYFAPDARYSSSGVNGQQVNEFKQMVKALHQAGIEVILDVVYNHTGEGNHLGPTLAFRGIDNAAYYRLKHDSPDVYIDYTGTGNTLNMMQPNVLRLIMDSLRYWVLEMHVDGFRFDLAAALARELHDVDRLSSFFDIIQQDPVISQVKLIAEPWDLGEGGYQVGRFPPGWTEWNGKYRDTVRDFWRGADATLAEFASRLTGSSDLYGPNGRQPTASINFVTAHDGFTLLDLVSYNEKHNQANAEDNRDGENHNRSWNCGVEGPTDNEEINALRSQQRRNLLATLLLSQGVPMLLGGDEFGRTQQGNNNAYCQDNEISWYNWDVLDRGLLDFTRSLIHFRKNHPVFRQLKWFRGKPVDGSPASDIEWFLPDGERMKEQDWASGSIRSLGVFLNGQDVKYSDPEGRPVLDCHYYILFNAQPEPVTFRVPDDVWLGNWVIMLDTSQSNPIGPVRKVQPGEEIEVPGRAILLMEEAEPAG